MGEPIIVVNKVLVHVVEIDISWTMLLLLYNEWMHSISFYWYKVNHLVRLL